MKKIVIAGLLSVFVAAPAFAADGKNSVGINYGTDLNGVFGIQGEFDISSMTNKQPVSVQVFWKKSSQTIFGVSADTTAIGAAGIYDFNVLAKLDKKIHPYAGAGLKHVSETVVIPGFPPFIPTTTAKATSTDFYATGGVRYFFTPQFDADLSYNNFGGLTIGANFNF
jgi:opacity protein-like surface antigen